MTSKSTDHLLSAKPAAKFRNVPKRIPQKGKKRRTAIPCEVPIICVEDWSAGYAEPSETMLKTPIQDQRSRSRAQGSVIKDGARQVVNGDGEDIPPVLTRPSEPSKSTMLAPPSPNPARGIDIESFERKNCVRGDCPIKHTHRGTKYWFYRATQNRWLRYPTESVLPLEIRMAMFKIETFRRSKAFRKLQKSERCEVVKKERAQHKANVELVMGFRRAHGWMCGSSSVLPPRF